MSSFSSILDVSSFFIGVLVNLLLVAMICFYFKRKIDNLELSQSEQAKILFQIVQDQSQPQGVPNEMYPVLNGLDLNQLGESEESDTVQAQQGNEESENESENESDGDSDSESDENESEDENDVEKDLEVKKIDYEQEDHLPDDYSKYTVKELRSLLENKGVSLHSRAMKKQELIDLISSTNAQVIEEVVKVEEMEEIEEVEESTPLVQPPEISDINE
tara:strand:+ start:5342 stop:5995 length:654 start_codon:yes stop_codon:yes gene_type:complete